jgi:hypothetical protein
MKLRFITAFLFVLSFFTCLKAQTAEELLKSNLSNLSIPNESLKTFSVDVVITSSGNEYLNQIRYDNGKLSFNSFDIDKTPLLIARDNKILLNDILNSKICLLENNIIIAKAVLENNQLNANINFHEPNDEENVNTIKIDFLNLALQAVNNIEISNENGFIIITGTSEKDSKVTSMINPKDSFPLKKLVISSEDFKLVFDKIEVNRELDKNYFIYPEKEIAKINVPLEVMSVDNVLTTYGMIQKLIYSALLRSAFNDKELQEQLQQALMPGEKIDWVKIKANDIMKSAKLRNLFKSF